MRVVYKHSDKNSGVCLLSPIDIFSNVSLDVDIAENDLDIVLRDLEIDDYFDITPSEKRGELVYCINMRKKGLSFARQEKAFKSNIKFKLMFALGSCVVTSLVAVGIRQLFEKFI